MKIKLILLIFVSSFTMSLGNFRVSNIPKELLKNADVVDRESNTIVTLGTKNKGKIKYTKAITIFKESDYQHLKIFYNSDSKIKKIKVSLFDQNGILIREVDKKEILDYEAYSNISILTDERLKYVNMSYGKYPYTVVY